MSDLYLIYVRELTRETVDIHSAVELDEGLYLVRTDRTRSQLYHAVKRQLACRKLLVAPLAALPKFKGMKPGATRAVKDLLR